MWGKTDLNGISRERGGPAFNPLLAHCLDTAAVCGELVDHYLATPVRRHLADAFGGGCPATARTVVMLLVALHDLPGKAQPGFQQLFAELGGRDEDLRHRGRQWERAARQAGLPLGGRGVPRPPHAHVTARYLPALLGCGCAECAYQPPGASGSPRHDGLHIIAAILGGHHGHVPPEQLIADADCDLDDDWQAIHTALVAELARLLGADLTRLPDVINPQRPVVMPLLAGLVVMCDWIASDETRFTYRTLTQPTDRWWTASRRQAARAVQQLRLHRWQPDAHASWADLHPDTPTPRTAQQAVLDAAPDGPVLAILESSTGSGKTESALWLAHHLAARCGYHGFYLAQATRAASDQLAARCALFLAHTLGSRTEANLALVHGTASLSALATELQDAAGPAALPGTVNLTSCETGGTDPAAAAARARAVLNAWFLERGRGLLSPFGVGTVDQIVLAAQASRHWFLRLFGLANKVVIIDEAHAYQHFQQDLLGEALAWLADAGASVIVLSATLPDILRQALIDAWCHGHRTTSTNPAAPGPLTFVDPHGTCRTLSPAPPPHSSTQPAPGRRTKLHLRADPGPEQLAERLLTEHADGITGVLRNRIAPATALYRAAADLAAQAGWNEETELLLLHARFLERDRARHQHTLERLLGPHPNPDLRSTTRNPHRPDRFLLIGTQVLEQSLDYCLDHLFTDLAPFDYLLQRRGRLWRHFINRPHVLTAIAEMHVLFTPASSGLPRLRHPDGRPIDAYAPYIQAATWHALTERMPADGPLELELITPDDTHPILQSVYAPAPPAGERPIHALLNETFGHWQTVLDEERNQARARSVSPYPGGVPCGIEELASGRLHAEPDDPEAPSHLIARSRLGEPSIDVIGLYQHPGGERTFDPEGHLPADLSRYHPRREADQHRLQQREFLLNTVRLPQHWFRRSNALPPPAHWTINQPEALAGKPVLLLTPDGRPHDARLKQLSYDPRTGLSHHD
ncbi:CRISPR-associated helicase/endonuclease Cas3 [Streptomyces aurantiacus]|uniref:Putative CRISPR-associated endonuclease Cas3 n=1 Tax=Streptomyces aurantiacus JA 4570 TaxID=1286094 RepID=S3ZRJ4_9ACTN|nr:CRISPR-associated helicase/endonuclease Cas3 [Streptomyces aurantiacus]EPH41025.1 putative CRISPR-associated endonuclease Cas3 [Streptomyces aurantiacus JA 4570]